MRAEGTDGADDTEVVPPKSFSEQTGTLRYLVSAFALPLRNGGLGWPAMLTKAQLSRLRALRDKKNREAEGRYVVENPKVVAELLAAGVVFSELYATAAWTGPLASGPSAVARTLVTADEMARISHFPTPSEVFAVGPIVRPVLPANGLARGLTLALDCIQDPGNVGTLLRVADWFAFDRVVLSPDCADLFSQKVINASMGSFARVKTFTAELPAVLAQAGAPVLGCDLGGDDVHGLRGLRDAVVVIGSEGRGLSPAVRSSVTQLVTIPRFGGAESLNAGVAAAIVCDNLRRACGR